MDRQTQSEVWRPVGGYEGQYLVSNEGRVMNNHGLVLKTIRDASNNKCVTLKSKRIRVALIVARAFVPNPEHLSTQGYKDGDKDNCCADNVIWINHDFNNDGTPRGIALIQGSLTVDMCSIGEAARFLKTTSKKVKMAANNKERNIKINGCFVAWSDDTERVAQLIEGVECVKSLEGEEWRDLPELNGEYMVSNLGRVKRIKGYERLVKETVQKNGYIYVSVTINKKPKCFKTSRLVAKAFIPNPNNYEEVDHINADKFNNTIYNLEWVSPEENKRRAEEMGLKTPHRWTEEEKKKISQKVKDTLANKRSTPRPSI